MDYSVEDEEGDEVTVTEAVDGGLWRTFAVELGAQNNFTLDGEAFMKLLSVRDRALANSGITPPRDWGDVEQVRAAKLQEIGLACSAAIYAGIDVGGSHYSLTEHDQTEIMAQYTVVKEGAPAVPYHADGELCRMYPAEEFAALAQAARPTSSTTVLTATTSTPGSVGRGWRS